MQFRKHDQRICVVFMTPDFVQRLNAILPSESILLSDEEMRPYECDGLSAYRQLPGIVVLPETVNQVQAIDRLVKKRLWRW